LRASHHLPIIIKVAALLVPVPDQEKVAVIVTVKELVITIDIVEVAAEAGKDIVVIE
jgi:hypothetical protein